MDTKSFLLDGKHTQRPLEECCDGQDHCQRVGGGEVDSLIAVLLGTREGLWVDVSQGDVLVPLQVSHQDSDL